MARSLVDLLTTHATHQPDRTAYRYLVTGDPDGEIQEISYARLATRSRAVAAWLQERGLAGSRAMLLHPPGLEFVCGYLGCLSAGVVAVPGVPPQGRAQNHRALTRMKRLIADADAKVILGGREVIAALGTMTEHLPELAGITCVATEDIADDTAAAWREPDLTADSVAFLQYTSGSTSAPKGVVVTHGNLLDNERASTSASTTADTSARPPSGSSTGTSAPARPPAWPPGASPTRSASRDPRSPSTPPAPPRWSRCISRRGRSRPGSATSPWRAARRCW
ncbi:D-alanine--D-alanyl carrier protein ligase [Streptomyces aurantiogriseus]